MFLTPRGQVRLAELKVSQGELSFRIDAESMELTLSHTTLVRPWVGRDDDDLEPSQDISLATDLVFKPGVLTSFLNPSLNLESPVRWLPEQTQAEAELAQVRVTRSLVAREPPPGVWILLLNPAGLLTLLDAWSAQPIWSLQIDQLAYDQNQWDCPASMFVDSEGLVCVRTCRDHDRSRKSVDEKHTEFTLRITPDGPAVLSSQTLDVRALKGRPAGPVCYQQNEIYDSSGPWWSGRNGSFAVKPRGVYTSSFSGSTTPQHATAATLPNVPGVLFAGHPEKPTSSVVHKHRRKPGLTLRPLCRARTACRFAVAGSQLFVLGGDSPSSFEAYDAERDEWFLCGALPDAYADGCGFVCVGIAAALALNQ
jgi:hypothetical protein